MGVHRAELKLQHPRQTLFPLLGEGEFSPLSKIIIKITFLYKMTCRKITGVVKLTKTSPICISIVLK